MTDNWWRVCWFHDNEGYGILSLEAWEEIPKRFHERFRVLCCCDTEDGAQEVYQCLTTECSEWKPQPMYHANSEWWRSTGIVVPDPDGRETKLFVPADRQLPVIEMPQGEIDALLGRSLALDIEGALRPIPLALLGAPR